MLFFSSFLHWMFLVQGVSQHIADADHEKFHSFKDLPIGMNREEKITGSSDESQKEAFQDQEFLFDHSLHFLQWHHRWLATVSKTSPLGWTEKKKLLVLQTSGSKNQAGTSGSIWYLQVFSGWDVKVHILIQCHEHFGKERHNSLYLLFCNCYSKSKQSLNCTEVHPSLFVPRFLGQCHCPLQIAKRKSSSPYFQPLLFPQQAKLSPCFFHSKPSVCIPSCQRGQMKLLNLEERNCEIQLAENMDHSLNSVHSSTLSFSCQYCRFPAFQLVINVGICWCMKSNTCTEEKWSFCCRCFCCCCNFCPPIRLIHRSIVDIPTNLSMLEMEGQPPCLGGKLTTSISGCRPWNGSSFFPSKCVLKVHLLLLLHVSHVISIAKRRFLTLFSRLYQVDNCPATLFTGGFGGPMTHDLVPFPCWLSL